MWARDGWVVGEFGAFFLARLYAFILTERVETGGVAGDQEVFYTFHCGSFGKG